MKYMCLPHLPLEVETGNIQAGTVSFTPYSAQRYVSVALEAVSEETLRRESSPNVPSLQLLCTVDLSECRARGPRTSERRFCSGTKTNGLFRTQLRETRFRGRMSVAWSFLRSALMGRQSNCGAC